MFQMIRHEVYMIIRKRYFSPSNPIYYSYLSIIILIQKRWKMQPFLLTSHPFGNSLRLSKEVFCHGNLTFKKESLISYSISNEGRKAQGVPFCHFVLILYVFLKKFKDNLEKWKVEWKFCVIRFGFWKPVFHCEL